MELGDRIEKINSTGINAGNTQATSADKELTTTIERWQRGSTRLFTMARISEPLRVCDVIT